MAEQELDENLQKFLEVRQPGVNYEEHQVDQFALDIGVDLTNFKKFPRVDDNVTYKKKGRDIRGEVKIDPNVDLPDYSGPFKADLRFSDFSKEQLVTHARNELRVLRRTRERLVVRGRFAQRRRRRCKSCRPRRGRTESFRTSTASPKSSWLSRTSTSCRCSGPGSPSSIPFKPDPRYEECDKERLVNMLLGSHEFFLLVIEAWAAEVVVRYGLDEMFDIQWELWSREVLPAVRELKGAWMNITTNDVAAFMKDIQIDATSFPGKAFELIFEMPEEDVGIMTFNKCCAPDQWEALGRPDILEKNCHSTCPASLIETAKMYNPNMKVDILAIPPRMDDRECVLQVETQHAGRGRSGIRSGRADDQARHR